MHSSRKTTTMSSSSRSALTVALIALGSMSSTAAQQCVSLRGSTACPAFNQSSISTGTTTRGLFPFLNFVSDVNSFDNQLRMYITTAYSQVKYQNLLGCSSVNLTNTTDLYARYTTTVLCNAIVQNSVLACGLTGDSARPVCADTCAEFAQSEESIAATPALCGNISNNALDQIRADFTTCALPNNSLTGACIRGYQNENENCGFSSNLPSLCAYCAASSPNSTDSCCLFSQSQTRCQNVRLPITTAMGNLFPSSTGSAAPRATNATAAAVNGDGSNSGLSGGAIAGIVIGSILGALLLLGLLVFCCILAKRRRESRAGSIFNQPSPTRQGPQPPMSYAGSSRAAPPPDVLPAGGRVHHMTALDNRGSRHSSPIIGAGFDTVSSGYDTSPNSNRGLGGAAIAKRGGSLGDSPGHSGDEDFSSPEGMASGQSEQMSHFKDYYSQDDIHPGDTVAVLWAYQPRANDEWELERGDMIKVVGIWDDGWATGVKISETAEEWEAHRNGNRDSGLSSVSRQGPTTSAPDGEIKAFPLVCVCLPQHWRKTIEGDTVVEASTAVRPRTP